MAPSTGAEFGDCMSIARSDHHDLAMRPVVDRLSVVLSLGVLCLREMGSEPDSGRVPASPGPLPARSHHERKLSSLLRYTAASHVSLASLHRQGGPANEPAKVCMRAAPAP